MQLAAYSRCWLLAAGALLLAAPTLGQDAAHEHPKPQVLAPGYAPLEFQPPPPGSYALPPLGLASDGDVVDSDGRAARLHAHLDGKIAVLSFIYTSCSDVNGCPLATHVLRGVQDRLLSAADLDGKVRLVSFSFDPARDTPQTLKRYGGYFKAPGFDWRFLTTASEAQLQPTLDAYNQWIIRDPSGAMSHLLRVYLIDRNKRIRNIYSVSFLHADTLLNDIRTLLLEGAEAAAATQAMPTRTGTSRGRSARTGA